MSKCFPSQDFLDHAAHLAAQIDPHAVAPNPRVGAVAVHNGKIVATGVHEYFGGPHAEQNLITNLSPLSQGGGRGVEIYITLEPCDHFPGKKTPSCTEVLIKLHPQKIIIGQLDPKFKGKSVEKLQAAGIETIVEENKASKALNPFFNHFQKTSRPHITLKIGQTLDGKIFSENFPREITGSESQKHVHKMRAEYSALLTTTSTIMADDPQLNVRLEASPSSKGRDPQGGRDFKVGTQEGYRPSNPKIIILGQTPLPKSANIFQIHPPENLLFFDTLDDFLSSEKMKEIDSIMTECGSSMATELLKRGLINEVQLFVAPKVWGHGKVAFEKEIDLKKFSIKSVTKLADDWALQLFHE